MIGPMRILRVILALIFVAFVLESVLLAIPGGGGSTGVGPPLSAGERIPPPRDRGSSEPQLPPAN